MLKNYSINEIVAASGGRPIRISAVVTGEATYRFSGSDGFYNQRVWCFDENGGMSTFRIYVNGVRVAEWIADHQLGSADAVSSMLTSRTISHVAVTAGAEIKFEAVQDAQEWPLPS